LKLSKRLDLIEPLAAAQTGTLEKSVYGIVDKIVDGKPHFVRKWKGTIGNMEPTDQEPTIYCIEKLEPFLIKHKKYKCAFGGRAGTKSIMAMDSMIGDVNSSASKVFVLRERMKALKESIYAGINDRIKDISMNGFVSVPSQWEIRHRTGGKVTFGGMQNIIDMKGSFNYKYFLMEEAARTSQETIDILGPTLRGVDGAELWYIWNAESATDAMSKEFIIPYEADLESKGYYEDDYHLIIKVGYEDNPWFEHDSSLIQEFKKDSGKVADGRMKKARFNHIWNGAFNDDIEDTIIEPDWFDACIDAHKKLGIEARGAIVATHDPADTGEDEKGFAIRQGIVFNYLEEIKAINANRAFDDACELAIKKNADVFGWDCDGLGAVLRDQATANFDNKKIETFMYKGSESVHMPDAIFKADERYLIKDQKTNRDVFYNKRAQNSISVAERCRRTWEAVVHGKYYDPDTLISFSSDVPTTLLRKLRSEMCKMPLKLGGSTIRLYTKQDMRKGILLPSGEKRKLPSPNLFDCVVMSFDDAAIINNVKEIDIDSIQTATQFSW